MDPVIARIIARSLPENPNMIVGTYFTDQMFAEDVLNSLMEYQKVGRFEAEHAIYTTDSSDLATLFRFIFDTHELLRDPS